MTRIVFFGTSNFSAEILQTLFENSAKGSYELCAVVTQPDKPVGRKQEITASAVAQKAEALKLKLLKPDSLKDSAVVEQLKELRADLFVVVAYGKIIPQSVLDLPAKGAINIHASILPKYRGASPIHFALLNGEKETGITIMLMDAQMDHGPILSIHPVTVNSSGTFNELEHKLLAVAKDAIAEAIPEYLNGNLQPKEQNHAEATFTKILKKEDGKIDWQKTAQEIFNQYRAFINWPGVWTTFDGKLLKIKKCAVSAEVSKPGLVFSKGNHLFVGTADGSLEILSLQLEGKNETDAQSFLRGHPEIIGKQLN